MRIDDREQYAITGARIDKPGSRPSPPSAPPPDRSDRAEMSRLSSVLQRPVDEARIEQLTTEVRSGRYQVDARQLSRRIVEFYLGNR